MEQKQKARTLIDWLTVSFPPDEVVEIYGDKTDDPVFGPRIASSLSGSRGRFVARGGMHGYAVAYEQIDGVVVAWNRPMQANGLYISYPGKALEHADWLALIDRLLSLGAKVSRLDLASDLVGKHINLEEWYQKVRNGDAVTNARRHRLVQSESGSTLYIGSRSSERFLRIYDKAGQEGVDMDWFRAELELKGGAAKGVARYLQQKRSLEEVPAIINAFFRLRCSDWNDWMETDHAAVIYSTKTRSNTADWLLNSVAPALARYLEKDAGFIEDFIEAVHAHSSDVLLNEVWGLDR
jgi:DNA relaxase NicK